MSKSVYLVEKFISLEGEGPYTGYPTIYARLAGCNLRCKGFNNPEMKDVLDFDPKDYNSLNDLPSIIRGCDSNYAVDAKKFNHLWKKIYPQELYDELLSLSPTESFKTKNGLNYALSITGGEPTIHQEFLIEFFDHIILNDHLPLPDKVIIETNATIPLTNEFLDILSELSVYTNIVWANSLKLSNSGEDIRKTINYDILRDQMDLRLETEQYFKFVTDGSQRILDEIHQVIRGFKHIVDRESILLMPEACNYNQLIEVGRKVANQCIDNGYVFCNRLQNVLWDNQIGT